MKHLAAGLAFLATACGTVPAGLGYASADVERYSGRREPERYASPGRIVAAEVALAQLARRKGTWSALRDTAADGAVMFAPQAVSARDWLKSRKDQPTWVSREPYQVWMSCDGSLAATYGAWQGGAGRAGYFATVWQRQKNGEYKWVMDQSDELAAPLATPEMISTTVASCEPRDTRKVPEPSAGSMGRGSSQDRTLIWAVNVDPTCGRVVEVKLFRDGQAMETVLTKRVAPLQNGGGSPLGSCVSA